MLKVGNLHLVMEQAEAGSGSTSDRQQHCKGTYPAVRVTRVAAFLGRWPHQHLLSICQINVWGGAPGMTATEWVGWGGGWLGRSSKQQQQSHHTTPALQSMSSVVLCKVGQPAPECGDGKNLQQEQTDWQQQHGGECTYPDMGAMHVGRLLCTGALQQPQLCDLTV